MLLDYYNLKEQPFGATPDPRYLYMSPTHREALASLCYGIQNARGFLSIVAQPGMGKTTTLFQVLNELQHTARTVFLFQTFSRPEDLLRGILHELGVIEESSDVLRMQAQLDEILLAEAKQGRRVVIVIDEAQNLEDSALELVRMLSNFETPREKLLQVVLSGQPHLGERLASPRLLQLRQRMSIVARLRPLNHKETHLYIEHRLRVAGYNFQAPLFTAKAEALIAKHSEGIPRNINNICFNALSLGWVLKQRSIDKGVIREVWNDIRLEDEGRHWKVPGFQWIKARAAGPKSYLLQSWSSSRRIAMYAMILLPLLWISSEGSRPRPAIGNSAAAAGSKVLQGSTSAAGMARNQAANRFVEVSTAPAVSLAALLAGKTEAGSTPGTEPQHRLPRRKATSSQSRKESDSSTDPAMLWKEVRKGRSDAEVKLARLYMEGTGVQQNCIQAEVLLQSASRKGNPVAADLLGASGSLCH